MLVGPALGARSGGQLARLRPRLRPPLPPARPPRPLQEPCLRSTSSASRSTPAGGGAARAGRRRRRRPRACSTRSRRPRRARSSSARTSRDVDEIVAATGPRVRARVRRSRVLRHRPRALGDDARLEVHPAPSSVALAFARLGLPWDDALVVSAHGRDPRARDQHRAAPPEGRDPHRARAPPRTIVEALDGRTVTVAEALGTPDERIGTRPAVRRAQRRDRPRAGDGRATVWPPRTPTRWALPEDAFEHRDGHDHQGRGPRARARRPRPGHRRPRLGRRLRQRQRRDRVRPPRRRRDRDRQRPRGDRAHDPQRRHPRRPGPDRHRRRARRARTTCPIPTRSSSAAAARDLPAILERRPDHAAARSSSRSR